MTARTAGRAPASATTAYPAEGDHQGVHAWLDRTRVVVTPLAAPSILGLFGFFAGTIMVGTNIAGWWGTSSSGLALWPFALLYGVAVVPAPGGGGAVEVAFKAALGDVIPHELFGAALLWWRFYTFYLYIILGALVAGAVVMRALRKEQEMEEELAAAE